MKLSNLMLLAGAVYLYRKTKKATTLGDSYWGGEFSRGGEDNVYSPGASSGTKVPSGAAATDAAAAMFPEYANILKPYPVSEPSAEPPAPSSPSIEWGLPMDVAKSIKPSKEPVKRRDYTLPVYDSGYYAALRESERLRKEQAERDARKVDKLFAKAAAPFAAEREEAIPQYSEDPALERYVQESRVMEQKAAERAQRARESALELDRIIARESRYGPDNLTQSGRAAVERELYRRRVSPGGRSTDFQILAARQRQMLREQAAARQAQAARRQPAQQPQRQAQGGIKSTCTDPKGCVRSAI